MTCKAVAVIVTFNPSRETLLNLLENCVAHSWRVVLVDNGSEQDLNNFLQGLPKSIELIPLGANFGIARAQNVGIERARALKADYVVLFDQDSGPESEMLPSLVKAIVELAAEGRRVACVGPCYFDRNRNIRAPFIRVEGLRLSRTSCLDATDIVPVDHLIASGSLIPIATLDVVGDMKEELFIDYVDLEWCERAKYNGYQAYGVCAARMEHALGDEPIKFMWTAYPARTPLRHYYIFRNAFWMYRQSYVRWNWKVVDGLRLLRKYVFYTLFAKPRHEHFWMMTKGIWHGLSGKMGRYEG